MQAFTIGGKAYALKDNIIIEQVGHKFHETMYKIWDAQQEIYGNKCAAGSSEVKEGYIYTINPNLVCFLTREQILGLSETKSSIIATL